MSDSASDPDSRAEFLSECLRGSDESDLKETHRTGIDMDTLLEICSRKLKRQAFHPKALITRAAAYCKKGLYEEALGDCTALLKKMPEHIQAHFLRGVSLDKLSRCEEAVEEFTQVLKLDPSHANAALSRAAALIKLGQPTAALDDYVQGLELDSKRSLSKSAHRKALSTSTYCSLTGSNTASPRMTDLPSSSSDLGRVKSFSQAVTPYPSMLGKDVWSAQELYMKGYAAKRARDYTAAVQFFSAALDLDEGNFKCLFNRAFVLERLGRFEDALGDYTKALELDPRSSVTYYNRAILLDKLGRTGEALRDFTAGIAVEDKAEFRHNRAQVYVKMGEMEKALADFTRTIELDRAHLRTHTHRGQCFESLNRRDDAVRDYETAITLHDDVEACRFWLSLMGASASAGLERLRKAKKISEAAVRYVKGFGCEQRGQVAEAMEHYTAAIGEKELEAEYWLARARCRLAMGHLQEALGDCKNAEDRGADVHYTRALVLTRLGMYEQAAEDLHHLTPTASVLLALGYVLSKSSNHSDAIRAYSLVLELDPNNAQALHNRGTSFQHTRKYAEVSVTQAIADFSAEINLSPTALAYFARGCCYEQQGAADKAIADYSKSLEMEM